MAFSDWLSRLEKSTVRKLTDEDIDGFYAAAEKRPMKERTIVNIQEEIKLKNPVRWNRMQRDLKWLKKQMRKMGLNPEEARWVL